MKKIRELDPQTLSTEQKLGLVFCANLNHGPEDVENALQMIREHRLGAVWITTNNKNRDEILARVKETADYPILIFCDAENGPPGYAIPGIISLSAAHENEAYAHSFGRLTSAVLAEMGYNVVCNPVLDRCCFGAPCGANTRSISPDKEVTARLSAAVIRGMHEGGTLSVAKHYPSEQKKKPRKLEPPKEEYLVLDGYNVIFAMPSLRKLAEADIGDARDALIRTVCNLAGMKKCRALIVFDAYRRKEGQGSEEEIGPVTVVYTKERQTADAFIEKTTYHMASEYRVRVVSSDKEEQFVILGHGALRVSVKEFEKELASAAASLEDFLGRK